ncbi:hypothetical protein OIDMADRAFT_142545 [Oidiodendron maius Zn]|uniref:Carbohydrate kinase PfkB domain-containing protein n=1 Tax=Oidiodendron maius (strain Zn) TaxID=913774 RepID=A0A0C3D0E5_OIDMZ|nr:hypothetical protein OIDMADRAFT_142545 [Oidiodendron maius Zn]
MTRRYLLQREAARISNAVLHRRPLFSCYSSVRQVDHESSPVALKRRHFASWLAKSSSPSSDTYFQISHEVLDAIHTNKPVVALETTIYTHGFPYPDNVALALELEAIVRSNGGIPATIGILEGIARVGLSSEELVALASTAGKPETMKVSRRDIPYIIGMGIAGRKINGGTTIAGTMFLAQRAGIKVFGTGGLGGVHRGGQDTMDISADLTELGRTPVAVISSGCKSFLDTPRTLEYLETQGAGVFTFADGRTGVIDYPAFYTRDSGVESPMVVQNAKEAAAIIFSQEYFPNSSGLHFANPIPKEYSIPKSKIDGAIDQAVKEAAEQGFHGHSNTPFILSRIKELTKGNSISANRALIISNITMATKVAVELSRLRNNSLKSMSQPNSEGNRVLLPSAMSTPSTPPSQNPAGKESSPSIVVFGSVAIDLSCDFSPRNKSKFTDLSPRMRTSNIATIIPSIGGVGHNVALAAQLAGGSMPVRLCSYVADDLAGNAVLATLKEEGLRIDGITIERPQRDNAVIGEVPHRTAQYVAVNDAKKDLVVAMADMSIFDREGLVPNLSQHISSALKWIIVDANWHPNTLRHIFSQCKSSTAKVAFEPVSVAKSAAVFQTHGSPKSPPIEAFPNHSVDLVTPNQHELAAMHTSAKESGYFESEQWWQVIDALGIPNSGARDRFVSLTSKKMTDEGIPLQAIQLLPFMPTLLTKLGADGVLLTELLKPNDPRLTDPNSAPYILSRTFNGSTKVGGVYMRHFPAVEVVEDVVSVNGVGDTFLGVLVAGLAKGLTLDERLIETAQRGAVMTLRSKESVSPTLGLLQGKLDELALTV